MFFYLSKILGFLLLPQGILIIMGFVIYYNRKNHTKVKRLSLLMICLTYLFCNQGFVSLLAKVVEEPKVHIEHIKSQKLGVVLTGGMTEEDQANIQLGNSSDRLWQALLLYKNRKIQKILISGGSISDENDVSENEKAKRFLVINGVNENDIYQELQSKNTYQNAKYSAEFIQRHHLPSNGILITSAYHMNRAKACFKKQNLRMETFPSDFIAGKFRFNIFLFLPNANNFKNCELLLKEIIGTMVYSLKGYI